MISPTLHVHPRGPGRSSETRWTCCRLTGGRRGGVLGQTLLVWILAAVCLCGTPFVSAQLCSWDDPPVLPTPEVVFLHSDAEGLRAPGRVAVDSRDNVYVADPTTGTVVVMNVHGRIIASRTGMGVPVAVAVDLFDHIYVGDQLTGSVDIFDAEWQSIGSLGQGEGEFLSPTDIAVDPDPGFGFIYVADGPADLIKVYGPDGQFLRQVGGEGSGPGQYDFPAAVWVSPAGELFVGDQNNDRIQVVDRQGTFIRCFGAQGGWNRNFGRIQGLTGDASGRLYVADAFQGHVRVFDANGGILLTVGSLGDHAGQFRTPYGLAIDGTSRLFVSSMNGGRLEVLGVDDFVDPPPDQLIFSDGFESGGVHAWSAAQP